MAGSFSLLWIGAGLLSLASVAPGLDLAIGPEVSRTVSGGFAIERAPDGHFYTEARAGETRIRMMADPGAEQVLLCADDARALGLEVTPGFSRVTLDRLSVGPHQVAQVEAVIAPDLPVSLLGRSFLARIEEVEVTREQMLLR